MLELKSNQLSVRRGTMNIISNQENVSASRFELWMFKFFYMLTFKKLKYLEKLIKKTESDIEANKNRKIF